MNTVTVSDTTLRVEPRGLDKIWSFTRCLDIPLDHVRGATFDPGANAEPKGIRRPGLAVPGKWAGTFVHDGERSFWNVSTPGDTVVITLAGERFEQLVLTVADPRALVDRINAAVV
ncbi:hypothetical protein JL107_14795 [Nakamurella flavida]|uniref:Uncharacterized protein n=1 Tax=Nakamurella flavida TaxID=363630 RepID=A0A938YQR5_9ACTN|nr:hypothetical protein [Nakamurella flavida]MBM9477717.1 hypothetical protein [Nakamurella flavida]MDP9779269.1 hypothetical protein [Nakamurella flavida]